MHGEKVKIMLLPNQIKAAIKPYITGHFSNMPSFYSVLQSYSSFSQTIYKKPTIKPPHLFSQLFKTCSKPPLRYNSISLCVPASKIPTWNHS
jgi:hypothetical protein